MIKYLTILVSTVLWLFVPAGNAADTHLHSNHLGDIVFDGKLFAAVGHGGTILTSSNGITWTRRPSGTDAPLYGIVHANRKFVAVGDSGTILTSPNGITWTRRDSGTRNGFLGVAWGNNTFVAVGYAGTVFTSPDGITWTNRAPGEADYFISSVGWGGKCFVMSGAAYQNGQGTILTSPDGINWIVRATGITNGLDGICNAKNMFVAVGTSTKYTGIIVTSPDGIVWTKRAADNNDDPLSSVGHGDPGFVAVGNNGAILSSPDGITWTRRTSGTANGLCCIVYGRGMFVAMGENGTILTSPNGVTWTAREAPAAVPTDERPDGRQKPSGHGMPHS